MKRWQVIEELVNSNAYTVGVELGVYRGETFKHLLKRCPGLHLTGVDLFDSDYFQSTRKGRPHKTFNLEQEYTDLLLWIRKHYPDRGSLIPSSTEKAVGHFEDRSLDFVFIDADHRYEAISRDIELWLPKVTGMVMGHDYNEREFPGVVKAVKERFGNVQLYDDHVWAVQI